MVFRLVIAFLPRSKRLLISWLQSPSKVCHCFRCFPIYLPWSNGTRRKWHPTPVFLPGKSHEWRSLAGYSPWGHKELNTTEWLKWTELMLVIAFLPRSKHLLISWPQSPSAVILAPLQKINLSLFSLFPPSIFHEVVGLDSMIFIFWMLSFKPVFFTLLFHFHQ